MKASTAQIVQTCAAGYALGGAAVALWGAAAGKPGIIQAGAVMVIIGAAVAGFATIFTPQRRR